MIRKDADDVVYKNEKGKFKAVIEEIANGYEKGQPVLVGTVSVEKSEVLSSMLKKKGIPHQVLKHGGDFTTVRGPGDRGEVARRRCRS